MQQALRSGLAVAEFWEMTPRETYMAIEAAGWRENQRLRQRMSMAWLTAALGRQKRMPSLKSLLARSKPARKLSGQELRRRRQEFGEMATAENVKRINEQAAKASK